MNLKALLIILITLFFWALLNRMDRVINIWELSVRTNLLTETCDGKAEFKDNGQTILCNKIR